MRYNINPELLRTILPLLAREEDKVTCLFTRSVALRKIVAPKPYSEIKLERCRRRFAISIEVPAVSASKYWLNNTEYYVTANDYYLMDDSTHRVAAARELGQTRITTRIHFENWCKPNMYRLDPAKAILWRQVEDGWRFIRNELTIEQIQALRLIGVGTMVYGPKGLRRDTFRISERSPQDLGAAQ